MCVIFKVGKYGLQDLEGLHFDRQFAVIDKNKVATRPRKYPKVSQIELTCLDKDHVLLQAPGQDDCIIDISNCQCKDNLIKNVYVSIKLGPNHQCFLGCETRKRSDSNTLRLSDLSFRVFQTFRQSDSLNLRLGCHELSIFPVLQILRVRL